MGALLMSEWPWLKCDPLYDRIDIYTPDLIIMPIFLTIANFVLNHPPTIHSDDLCEWIDRAFLSDECYIWYKGFAYIPKSSLSHVYHNDNGHIS